MNTVIDLDTYELPRKEPVDMDVLGKVGKLVKKHCTCGGRCSNDPCCCKACKIWNELRFQLRGLV